MNYKILNSGSDGNCTLINDIVAIDMGVSYKLLTPHVEKLRLVLLTHAHSDHFNKATIRRLAKDRPTLRFGCCKWLVQELINCCVDRSNIDVYEVGLFYDYKLFKLMPVKLYHDVPNCGYRVFYGDEKLIYATDTYTLDGIKAIEYDYYLIEGNYQDEEELSSRAINNYYESRVKKTHLSKEYARNWLLENMGLNSVYCWMHEHKEKENGKICEEDKN